MPLDYMTATRTKKKKVNKIIRMVEPHIKLEANNSEKLLYICMMQSEGWLLGVEWNVNI